MRKSDKQYGVPFAEYSDTKANIEAIAAPVIGMSAYATDNPTAPVGTYNGTSWDWQPLTGGGGITDAPADGVYYGRRNNLWTNLKTYFDTLYAAITHNHSGTYEPANANIQSHIASTSNPHAVTAAQVGITTGTYTSTLTNVTNIAASTVGVCQYMHIGNVVTVSGNLTIAPTAIGAIEIGLSLPVTSNFTIGAQLGGAAAATLINQSLSITANVTNGNARVMGNVADTANRGYGFSFTYLVI